MVAWARRFAEEPGLLTSRDIPGRPGSKVLVVEGREVAHCYRYGHMDFFVQNPEERDTVLVAAVIHWQTRIGWPEDN